MIGQAGWWTRTPSATPLQPKKQNACFWIMFKFWWLPRLVDGLELHLPPLSSQKNETFIFGLRSTSHDRPGWSMDSNPICHPSPAKKNKMLIFGLHSTSDDQPGLVDGLEPHLPPFSSQKNKMLVLGWLSTSADRPGWSWTQTPSATPFQAKKWNAHFWITFDFWWSASWLMDSNPILHPSPAKKIKCSFLDYIQLLMISWAGRWIRNPSATPLHPKYKKLVLDYIQLLMISWAGQWTWTQSATVLQPKK